MKYLGPFFAIILCATTVAAQPSSALYGKALTYFHNNDMEDACNLLKKLNAESPADAQTKMYMTAACNALSHMRAQEEDLFNQGVKFFNQADYSDAKQKFSDALNVQLKTLPHRPEINRYLARIRAIANRQSSLNAAVNLFRQGRLAEAKREFEALAGGSGPIATKAQSYLTEISQAQASVTKQKQAAQVYNDGMKLFQQKHYAEARSRFEEVIRMNDPSEAIQAASMIGTIAQITNKPQAGANAAPAGTRQEELRAGLEAYFNADYDQANHDLTDYINQKGSKLSLAYFFRGAVHGTEYFLSGEAASEQKSLALSDFRQAHVNNPSFQPSDRLASPKILNLYLQSLTSSQP